MEKILYKLSKHDSILVFELKTVPLGTGYVLVSRKGYLNGAMQEDVTPISPRNVGRANETTPQQQAEMELISKYNKLGDKGYKDTQPRYFRTTQEFIDHLRNLKGTDVHGRALPMLAQKNIDRITFPGFLQRKYDGMRGILYWEDGKYNFRSRNGKILENLGHILEEVDFLDPTHQLDGELYAHGFALQDIVSMTKRTQPDSVKIKFRVYDLISEEPLPYRQRLWIIREYLQGRDFNYLEYVPTFPVKRQEQIDNYFTQWRAEGYEGAMWRNPEMEYEKGQRSWGLIKVKDFDEYEYEIVGVEEATGRDEGTAIFICITKEDKEFRVRPMGTRDQRKEYLDNFENYGGKLLTVRHQGFTNDGIPFHSRGVAIRDYE